MPMACPDGFQDGPILDFLTHAEDFEAVHLLFDQPKEDHGAVAALAQALRDRDAERHVGLHLVPVKDPRHYRELYKSLRATCEAVEHAHPAASFHILLTPGTPQVHATWVLLAKTVFPATPWQTSEADGASRAEVADIPFDVQAELVEPARKRALGSARPVQVPGLVFRSDAMARVVQEVGHVASLSDAPILLLGDTGVGKERLARYAHSVSSRSAEPFVGLNCAAIPAQLLEAELFGHTRGAFTGAAREREGLFEAASAGTLFLDEIAELAVEAQAKLLRVLQEKELRRVGGTAQIAVNPRIIAATHQDLHAMVKDGRFREDLYYRLAVCPVRIPSLRERTTDIAALVDHFLTTQNKIRRQRKRSEVRCSAAALRLLELYAWPGNVRELENAIERVSVLAAGGVLGSKELKSLIPSLSDQSTYGSANLNEALDEVARKLITQALARHGTQEKAAQALGLKSGSALQTRMRRLGVSSSSRRTTRRAR